MTSNSNINPSPTGVGAPDPQGPSNPASASTSASISAPASKSQTLSASQPLYPGLGANFAHNPQGPGPYTVNYDQEAYSQYMADEEAAAIATAAGTGTGTAPGAAAETKKTKTPKQIYRELYFSVYPRRQNKGGFHTLLLHKRLILVRLKQWVRRALNPAISDPRGDPSPIDFECAEHQRVRERI
ncbi:hypothetical protein BDV06DRAFT_179051 [Aspergillus oleicola]